DDGIPEPADVVLCPAVELTPVVDALLAHEGGHTCPLHGRGVRSPDDLARVQLAYVPPMQYGPRPMGRMLPVGEAARALNVSVDTLRRWERAGRIVMARD